ncbi:MAG: hypothetical protein FWD83_03955 [Promicromonosporaceae bacterium]|nr:hypothetical protein [Promicromonosporaceae bacterium]
MSLQGYTGPPAKRYLSRCEEAMGHAHREIAWASTFAPGVQPARQLPLPYLAAAANVRPSGVARGVGASTHVVVDRDALVAVRTKTRAFVSSVLPRVQAGLRECDSIVQTDLRLPQASAGVQFVTARLRQLLPQYTRMVQDSDRLVGDYTRTMLTIGGAGESMALVHSQAEGVRLETERVMRRQLSEVQDYAGNLRNRAGRVTGDATVLQRSTTTPNTTTAAGGRETVAQQIDRLTGQAANMRTAAGRMDNLASDLTDAIRKSNRIFAEDAEEVAGRDRQYGNQARRLADLMESFRKQIIAIGQSFNPDGSFNFGPLLSLDNWNAIRRDLKPDQLANLLAALGDHAQVRSLWDTLSPAQREALVNATPAIIGNLDGIPFGYRAQANVINMENSLRYIEEFLAEMGFKLDELGNLSGSLTLPQEIDPNNPFPWETRPPSPLAGWPPSILADMHSTITSLLTTPVTRFDQNGVEVPGTGLHVVAFDLESSSIITYHGMFDPATGDIPSWVTHIGVDIPGTGTSIRSFLDAGEGRLGGAAGFAQNIYEAANERRLGQEVGGSTAMFSFGDGRFPQCVLTDSPRRQFSDNLAGNLVSFSSLLKHGSPGAEVRFSAHSYGTAVLGTAQLGADGRPALFGHGFMYIAGAGLGRDVTSTQDFPNTADAPHFDTTSGTDFINLFQWFHGPATRNDANICQLDPGNFYNERGEATGSVSSFPLIDGSHSSVRNPNTSAFNQYVQFFNGELDWRWQACVDGQLPPRPSGRR